MLIFVHKSILAETCIFEVMKNRKNITIDPELLSWVEEQIRKKRFASLSHAIEYALTQLKEKNQNKLVSH